MSEPATVTRSGGSRPRGGVDGDRRPGESTRPATVIGFPGQGAQRAGMGAELFERFPDLVAECDEVLGYSIARLCADNPDNALRLTQYAQPALYVVEALAFLAHQEHDPTPPDYLLGHSVGEYAALFASGAVGFTTGLRLVVRRGELMSQCTQGSMAAVLGLSAEQVHDLLRRPELAALDVALYNGPEQTALAGPADALDRLIDLTAGTRTRCVQLNVSGPFHSRYMRPAAREFARFLETVRLVSPRIPVIANATGRPHLPDSIAGSLVNQIDGPVYWHQSIQYLLSEGDFSFVELGPGQTLTGMVKKIRGGPQVPSPRRIQAPGNDHIWSR